jgi:D-alanyl-lipoteichoic acid acyltransferase DltB (MBOAT superfamily)
VTPASLISPIGISFFTFKILSYIAEVYYGKISHENNFFKFLLYVIFFPQVLCGPIDEASFLLPQLMKPLGYNYDRIKEGFYNITVGLIKKKIIADSIIGFVTIVYDRPQKFYGWPLVVATILARYQIYCDFSGYSDIAIGISKIFGINISQNFKSPFSSGSISEHWRRWHITFYIWIKKNILFPLMTSPMGKLGLRFNILITFIFIGIWHGITLNFIIYGAINGVLVICDLSLSKQKLIINSFFKKMNLASTWNIVCIVITFLFFICIPSIFFVSKTTSDSIYVVKNLFQLTKSSLIQLNDILLTYSEVRRKFFVGVFFIILMEIFQSQESKINLMFRKYHLVTRWLIYFGIVLMLCSFSVFKNIKFVYLQF